MNTALISHHLPPPPFEIYENETLNGGDSFGLEFAASQWQRLVANAEGLFQKLVLNGLSDDSRNQIEQWLCLKQECEDCFNNDTSIMGLYDKTLRSLERIDEVTEYETKTSSSADSSTGTCDSESDSESDYDEIRSDELTCDDSVTSRKGDNKFTEKLECQMNKFRTTTDLLVNSYIGVLHLEKNTIDHSTIVRLNNINSLNRRRRSVLACEILPQVPTCGNTTEGGDWDQNSNAITDSGGETPKSFKERMKQKFKKSDKHLTDELTIINNNIDQEDKFSNSKNMKENQKKNPKEQQTNKFNAKIVNKNECSGSKKKMHKIVKLLKMEEDLKGNNDKVLLEEEKKLNKCSDSKIKSGAKPKSKDSNVLESLNSENGNALCMLRDNKEEEAFRKEIINLRETRDLLMDQRRSLDSKLNKDKVFSNDDERKFLEVDEAIEAIDAVMEHKNELLCGHKGVLYDSMSKEKGEIMLIDRLMKLSEPEMRLLLYKYFKKAVDLRESGRKMEQLLADQDYQIEKQSWKIQYLCNALQQVRIESERRLIMVHREHEEKLHFMLQHYTQNSSSTGNSVSKSGDVNSESSCTTEPQLLELPGTFANSKPPDSNNALTIPQQNLKKLQGSSTHTTKVTRKKNKLIIQQHRSKKNHKL